MSRRPGELSERGWSRAAYFYALTLALGLTYFLIRMPYQVTDDLDHILMMQFQSPWGLIVESTSGGQTLRPMMWLQQKALFELAPADHYFATFKAFNAVQLLAVAVLFVRLLRVRTMIDLLALPLALTALVGLHTYNITMREGYPVNHFMTILVCCLIVTNLSLAAGRVWWRDAVAVVVLVYALLTIEIGLVVWVCMVAGYAAGWRGVSGKAVIGATMVVAGYLIVRVFVLQVGTRALASMSSGYGFSVRDTGEILALFGDAPWKFYLYNVACAALTVLFSEPRAGVFQFTAFLTRGEVPLWSVINVAVSTMGTALIAIYAVRRMRHWRQRPLEHEDGLLLLFMAVLGANAAISFPYLKDVVMSPAGIFYAAALFVATRDLLRRLTLAPSRVAAAVMVIPLLVFSAGWTLRAVNLIATMRATAFVNRSDWAVADEYEDHNRGQWRTRHPDAQRLFDQLHQEVIRTPVPQPYTVPRWTRTWLDPY